jgi:hypothetical protein
MGDFHIDLEREGKLLCLHLTGEEGIKPFIRLELRYLRNLTVAHDCRVVYEYIGAIFTSNKAVPF